MIRVFSAGMPPDSMWLEPTGTWTDICAGRRSADGLFIRAEDALRLAAPSPDWCGSEGGMARNVIVSRPDNGEDAAADQQLAAELSAADAAEREDEEALDAYLAAPNDESDFERRECIASEVGDRKLDQQHDNT